MLDINLLNPIAPIVGVSNFTEDQYRNVTLNIPKGSLAFYQANSEWNKFFKIVEIDFSGVESANADDVKIAVNGTEIRVNGVDEAAQMTVYDTMGAVIYSGNVEPVNVPVHGVYIVKVAGVTRKVVL